MRVLVTADLHVEASGPEPVRRLVAGMDREHPDLVVLAGDLGNPATCWEECLACFLKLDCPVAVLPGNHDVWFGGGASSEELYRRLLPRRTRELGFHWLEDAPLRLPGGVAVAGNIGWYDYSARAPEQAQTDEFLIKNKARWAADAWKIDWGWNDFELAADCRVRLNAHLAELENDAATKNVLVVTHVPTFEEQLVRRPEHVEWSAGTAFFGHLTMGEEIARHSKVRYAIAGHTHVGTSGVVEREGMAQIDVAVVASDYLRPRWITVDLG